MNRTTQLVLVMAGLLTFAGACSKDEKSADTEAQRSAASHPAPAPIAPVQGATMPALFSNYEAIRDSLARDTASGVNALAKALADGAGKLAVDAEETHKPILEALAAESTKLSAVSEDELEATRMAFGEVSRSLVALVEADSLLADGLHVFECPMAKGYKRWIQPSSKLENPYMGQQMLACGSEVTRAAQ